jgi:hypothetical protein
MLALRARQPGLRMEIFTRVPEWFFADTLQGDYGYHSLLTDIGMAQRNPLEEDAPVTLSRLQSYLPFTDQRLDELVAALKALDCRVVVSDISPLGIAAARRAGLPSVLVENFTWDWIYAGYLAEAPGLAEPMEYLQHIFDQADYHIQTEPVCDPKTDADLVAAPISRPPRTSAPVLRKQMGVQPGQRVVLITLGGIEGNIAVSARLKEARDLFFVIPGGAAEVQQRANQLLLPHHSDFYHPDLVHASDGVVGKPGYSTLAETYSAGIPFAYLPRPRFREYPVLADYIEKKIGGVAIAAESFEQGEWIDAVRGLLERRSGQPRATNGAEQVAEFILRV